jgi:hypothetical protein
MLRLNLTKTAEGLKSSVPLPVQFKFDSSWTNFGVAVSKDLIALAGGETIKRGKTKLSREILFIGHEAIQLKNQAHSQG